MPIEVFIVDDFALGDPVLIVRDRQNRMVWDWGIQGWVPAPTEGNVPPMSVRLVMTDDMGRAILTALTQRYQGTDDQRQLRQDLEYERGRSEKLMAAVVQAHEAYTKHATGR